MRNILLFISPALACAVYAQEPAAPGADVRVLGTSTVIELESRNAWTTTREDTVEILTRAGLGLNSEISVSYNPVWQTVEILEAVVSNQNGAVFTLTPNELNIMDAPWVASAPDYPAGKILRASLPGVEVGSVIRTVVRTTQKDAPFFSHLHTFGGFDPVDEASFEVRDPNKLKFGGFRWWRNGGMAPAGFPASWMEWNPINGSMSAATDQKWAYKNLPALHREDGLPELRTLLPTIALSSTDSGAYSKILRDAIDPLVKPSKQIREHARKIATPFKTREEKIKALRDDVLKNIRLAGPSFTELPLSTLSTPDATRARGYGHALDRMILLDAMLRAEGFKTEIIFVESRKSFNGPDNWTLQPILQRDTYTVPLIEVLPPERSLWDRWFGESYTTRHGTITIGDGDQYMPLGATAYVGFNALCPASPQSRRVWLEWDFRPQTKSDTVIHLQPNGDAIIAHTNWHCGVACAAFRKHTIEQSPEERRREHLELISGFSRGAEPLSELVTETEAHPGYTAFTLRAPRFAALDKNTMTVLLPPPPVLPLPLRSDRRFNPMLTSLVCENKTVRVVLPDEFSKQVAAPTAFHIRNDNLLNYTLAISKEFPGMHIRGPRRDETEKPVTLVFNYSVSTMGEVRVEPDMYPLLLEENRKITDPSQRTLVLQKE